MAETNANGELYLTRREAEVMIQAAQAAAAQRQELVETRMRAHQDVHEQLGESIRVAIEAVDRERVLHVTAHEAAHVAHNREHALDAKATEVANVAHQKAHDLEAIARDKAEGAIDKRLEGMNEVRAALKDQAVTFARIETVNALTDRVIAIEKLDIRGEGKSLGQGAVIAYIVTAVTLVGALLGIVIVVSNFATGTS